MEKRRMTNKKRRQKIDKLRMGKHEENRKRERERERERERKRERERDMLANLTSGLARSFFPSSTTTVVKCGHFLRDSLVCTDVET